MRSIAGLAAFLGIWLAAVAAYAQPSRPDLQGMWSDPPVSPEDYFCYFYCTGAGLERLSALLDDPANDSRTYADLVTEAQRHQTEHMRSHLTEAALAKHPRDPAQDPGYLHCEPWGFARQLFAPHQLEIRQFDDRVEMRYGEWDARRTIYLDDRAPPAAPSRLGFSRGRYEDDRLIVETSHVEANLLTWMSEHSGDLRAVEVYTRSDDGQRLLLTVTMQDSWTFKQPFEARKVWGFAPDQQIFAYEDCEPAAATAEGAAR